MVSLSILVLELEQYSWDGWTDRCVRNWIARQAPYVAVNGSYTALSFIKNRGLHGSLLWPSLFSIFFKDLEEFIVDTIFSSMGITQNGKGQLICLGTGSPPRDTYTGWNNRPTRSSGIRQKQNAKSCTWPYQPLHWYRLGTHWQRSGWLGCCWKWSGDPDGDSGLNTIHQWAVAKGEANRLLVAPTSLLPVDQSVLLFCFSSYSLEHRII